MSKSTIEGAVFLFLDFDGVTNSVAYRERNNLPKVLTGLELFAPENIAPLNRIIEDTGALYPGTQVRVIISSSWRISYSLGHIGQLMARAGFTGRVTGATGNIHGKWLPDGRFEECQQFVSCWPRGGYPGIWRTIEIPGPRHVSAWVVIDDYPLTGADEAHFHRTDHLIGLTDECVEKVIAKIKAQIGASE